jgi:hypothetical protein
MYFGQGAKGISPISPDAYPWSGTTTNANSSSQTSFSLSSTNNTPDGPSPRNVYALPQSPLHEYAIPAVDLHQEQRHDEMGPMDVTQGIEPLDLQTVRRNRNRAVAKEEAKWEEITDERDLEVCLEVLKRELRRRREVEFGMSV